MDQFKLCISLRRRLWIEAIFFGSLLLLSGCEHGRCDEGAALQSGSRIVQSVIDDQSIQKFLHVDTRPRERLPLIVTGDVLGDLSEFCVKKGGKMVKFVSTEDAKQKGFVNYLVFTKFDIQGGRAEVEFDYPMEGLTAVMNLERADGNWVVVGRELSLH